MTYEDEVEAVAKAIHDKEIHEGAWDDYGCWTTETDYWHEEYRKRARAAIDALDAIRGGVEYAEAYPHNTSKPIPWPESMGYYGPVVTIRRRKAGEWEPAP